MMKLLLRRCWRRRAPASVPPSEASLDLISFSSRAVGGSRDPNGLVLIRLGGRRWRGKGPWPTSLAADPMQVHACPRPNALLLSMSMAPPGANGLGYLGRASTTAGIRACTSSSALYPSARAVHRNALLVSVVRTYLYSIHVCRGSLKCVPCGRTWSAA